MNRKIKAFVKAAALLGVILLATGCASSDFRGAFGSVTYPNPQSPEYVFVVEKKDISDTNKSALGFTPIGAHTYDMPIHNCIAQALIEKFPNSRIELGEVAQPDQIKIGNYRGFTIQQGWVSAVKCRFSVDVTIQGATRSFDASASAGALVGYPSEKAAKNACDEVVGDIKEYLQSLKPAKSSMR